MRALFSGYRALATTQLTRTIEVIEKAVEEGRPELLEVAMDHHRGLYASIQKIIDSASKEISCPSNQGDKR